MWTSCKVWRRSQGNCVYNSLPLQEGDTGTGHDPEGVYWWIASTHNPSFPLQRDTRDHRGTSTLQLWQVWLGFWHPSWMSLFSPCLHITMSLCQYCSCMCALHVLHHGPHRGLHIWLLKIHRFVMGVNEYTPHTCILMFNSRGSQITIKGQNLDSVYKTVIWFRPRETHLKPVFKVCLHPFVFCSAIKTDPEPTPDLLSCDWNS